MFTGLKELNLKAKATLFSWLFYMCHIRLTAVVTNHERVFSGRVAAEVIFNKPISSDTMYFLISFRKSTPLHNRQLYIESVMVNKRLTILWGRWLSKTNHQIHSVRPDYGWSVASLRRPQRKRRWIQQFRRIPRCRLSRGMRHRLSEFWQFTHERGLQYLYALTLGSLFPEAVPSRPRSSQADHCGASTAGHCRGDVHRAISPQ